MFMLEAGQTNNYLKINNENQTYRVGNQSALLYIKMNQTKIYKIFVGYLILAILNGYFFNFINDTFFHFTNPEFDKLSEKEAFFLTVIIAPIIETLILQVLIYKILRHVGIKNGYICIGIMSVIFSQMHWYYWLYVVMTFVSGLIINSFYIKLIKLKNTTWAFLFTMSLHLSYNLYGFLFVK